MKFEYSEYEEGARDVNNICVKEIIWKYKYYSIFGIEHNGPWILICTFGPNEKNSGCFCAPQYDFSCPMTAPLLESFISSISILSSNLL